MQISFPFLAERIVHIQSLSLTLIVSNYKQQIHET